MTVPKYIAAALALFLAGVDAAVPQAVFLESSKAGMSFLRITPNAANAGLAGAGLARSGDAAAFWVNPSLLAFGGDRTAQFSHTEFVEGIRQEYASITGHTGLGSLGASVQLFDSGDIEGRDENRNFTGDYSIKYVALSLGYARTLTETIALGVTWKQLFEKVADEDAGGYAVDAGITWRTPVEGLTAAAVARNYGRMGALRDERTKLPSDFGVGVLYGGVLPGVLRPFRLAVDYLSPRYSDPGIRLGVEVEPVDRFFVRTGYRTDSDDEDVSFGVGLDLGRFAVDVSYTPMEEFSDNALRFTLSLEGF